MKQINCIILDDEPFALALIEGYVKRTPFLKLTGKFHNGFEALELLNNETIDLAFVDIQMPDIDGIAFSKAVPLNTKIIFTTAFREFAFEGFQLNALDYLLKPFNFDDFLKAANKAFVKITTNQTINNSEEENYIFVKSEYRQLKINLKDVFYFEGLGDYVKIWLVNETKPVMTLMTLKMLETELPPSQFMRIHRSFIIALHKIDAVERSQVIINKQRITISDQYKTKFNDFMGSKSVN